MSTSSFALPSGKIPAVGYGCWKVEKEKAESLIESVIKAGYRHIDVACDYGNEREARLPDGKHCNVVIKSFFVGWPRYQEVYRCQSLQQG